MPFFTGEIIGSEKVVYKLNAMPSGVQRNIERAINSLTIKLQRDVKSAKLSGQVLRVKTGTLRRSIDQSVKVSGSTVVGKVSTNVKYGRAHEYGFSGEENVKSHLRTISQAFGKPIAPRQVSVRAFSRKTNIPEKSFLRSALKDMVASGIIPNTLEEAVKKAVE